MARSTPARFIKRFTAASYALAILAVAIAAGLRLALDPILGSYFPLLTFFGAVFFTARFGGRGPGLVATVVSVLCVWYLFLEPRYSFGIGRPQEIASLVLFSLTGIGAALLEAEGGFFSGTAGGSHLEAGDQADLSIWYRAGMVGAVAIVLGILASLLSVGFQRSVRAERLVGHTYQVLDRAAGVRSSLERMEISARGYLLTGDGKLLQSFRAAVAVEETAFQSLRSLTADNSYQQARLDQFAPIVRGRLDDLSHAIDARRQNGAAGIPADDQGRMERLAGLLNQIDQEEHRLLESRIDTARKEDSRGRWILGAGTGSLVLLLFVAGTSIERHMHIRRSAERLLARQARLIDLSHDAIVTADGNRVILAWNYGAQEMYGWTEKEAVGQVIDDLLQSASDVSQQEIDAILNRDGRWDGELQQVGHDGTQLTVESRQLLLRDEKNRPAGLLAISRNITSRKQAEETLRQSERRLRSLTDNLPEAAIYQYSEDSDGKPRVDFISAGIERLTGVSAAEFMSDPEAVRRNTLGEDLSRMDTAIAESRANLTRFEFEMRHKHRVTGEIRWSMLRSTPNRNADGSTTWYGIELDVTDRKRIEEALRVSEEKFARAFATNPAAIAVTRRSDGRFTEVNETWQEILGYSRQEAIGRTSLELNIWPDEEARAGFLERLGQTGSLHTWEQTLRRRSGETVVMLFSTEILTIAGEEVILSTCLDITDRKRAEQALREGEAQFRILANAIPQLCWMANADGWITWYNDRWYDYTGTTPQDMEGWGWKSVHDPRALPDVLDRWASSIATGRPFDMTFPLRGADGAFRPFLTRVMPVLDGEGKVVRWFGTNTDVSEQRRIENALREKSEQLRTALEAADMGAWEYRFERGEVHWDDTCCRISGLPVSGRVEYGQTLQCLHPDDRAGVAAAVAEALSGDKNGRYTKEFRVVWADGSVHWIASHGRVYFVEEGGVRKPERFTGMMMDITERKRAEEALRESQAKLEAAMSAMTDAVFISDVEGQFVHFNDAFATFHRFHTREECSRRLADYPALLDVYTMDGELQPLGMWAVPRALRGERSTNSEYALRRRDTGQSWIGSYSYGPIRDLNGAVVGSVVVGRDITDRKQAEEEIRRLNAELERRVLDRTAQLQASNQELEAFAYSVSHDLRAPLRGIDGWSLALMEDYGEQLEPRALQYLDRVRSETQRMGLLIDDLLQLSRITRVEMHHERVDLSRAAESIAGRLREANPGRHVEFAIHAGLTAYGDGRLLEVVLTNLLENAVKFTRPRERARIEFASEPSNGSHVFVVRDNGVGFDMKYAGQLFGAFQRLHSQSDFPGTGIGLATVQRVVRRHGGSIWAEAEPDRGAAIYFTIGEPRPAEPLVVEGRADQGDGGQE